MAAIQILHSQAPDTIWTKREDRIGRDEWMAWHDARHRTYQKRASFLGVSLPACDLTGEIDREWFSRHFMRHQAERQLFPREIGQLLVALERVSWDDENDFIDWHRRHALIHAREDALFGVV